MRKIRVRVTKDDKFDSVFGAERFRRGYPGLFAEEGVWLGKLNGLYYIWDEENDWICDETALFTWKDIRSSMKVLDKVEV